MLLSSFNFETLVSWQSMNDMLIINIIYTSKADVAKRREKLRFLALTPTPTPTPTLTLTPTLTPNPNPNPILPLTLTIPLTLTLAL